MNATKRSPLSLELYNMHFQLHTTCSVEWRIMFERMVIFKDFWKEVVVT
jgi:hypothetical protein